MRTKRISMASVVYSHKVVHAAFYIHVMNRERNQHRGYNPTPASLQRMMRVLTDKHRR